MKKIIGYIRVSTNTQDLQRQRNLIDSFAALNCCEVVEYISENITGTTSNRSGYQKLLTITTDYADTVLMTEVSRFSREEDIMKPLNQVNDIIHNGLTVVFMDNDIYDTQSYKDKLSSEQIQRLAAEFEASSKERNKIIRRMTTGKLVKFKQFPNGLWGRVPFGYKRVPNPDYKATHTPRAFKERDDNAEVVKQIFQWVIDGASLRNIALRLQSKGIKLMPSTRFPEGNDFDDSSIANIIHNPIYKGEWRLKDATINWDGIVTRETWDRAQEALKHNRINTIVRNVNYNPLKGIFKCPCGRSMYIINDRNYKRYRCAVKKDKYDKQICPNGGTGYDIVIKAVWNAILCSANDIKFANETTTEIERLKAKVETANADISGRKQRIEEVNMALDKVAKMIFDVPTMADRLLTQSKKAEEDIETLKKEIKNIALQKSAYLSQIELLEEGNTVKPDEEYCDEEKAEVFKRLLDKVTYYDVAMHKGFLEINFKNGIKMVYIILAARNKIIRLPITFKLIDRKIEVEFMDKLKTYKKSYNIDELEEKFPDIFIENQI